MDSADLGERHQEVLTSLLSTDLELAYTFLEVAEVTNDPEHRAASFEHAKTAVSSIRSLFRWIEDADTRRHFEHRADKLETAIHRTQGPAGALPVTSSAGEAR